MAAMEHSLRELVEKWLGATSAGPMRILLMRRSRIGGTRCLHIQAQRSADTVAPLFFRHENGNWQVFPPESAQPAMRVGWVFE